MHLSREVRIETATSCGYDCVMCPREVMTRAKRVMPMDVFLKVLDKLAPYKHIELITFAGYGESFLDPSMSEKILEVKERDYKVHLITTGITLNHVTIDTICLAGVEELRFSMYAMDSETYKKVHGFDGYDKVMSNIEEVLRRHPFTRPKVILEFIKLKENEHQLEDWLNYWEGLADIVEVWNPHNWATPTYGYRELDKENRRTCGRPFSGPYQVQVDGTMNLCCFDFDNKLVLGDLVTESLQAILEGSHMKHYQRRHTENDYTGLVCDDCDQLQDHPDACIFTNAMEIEDRVLRTSSGLDIIKEKK